MKEIYGRRAASHTRSTAPRRDADSNRTEIAAMSEHPADRRLEGFERNGLAAAEISDRVVGLLKRYTGRGPTRARTIIDGDAVVCVLHDTLTPAEATLAARGEAEVVLAGRRAFRRAMQEEARTTVEEVMGRGVTAFLSDTSLDPDVSVEVFMLDGAAGSTSSEHGAD